MDRVRDQVMPGYVIQLAMMRADLAGASKAILDRDLVQMFKFYRSLLTYGTISLR